MAQQITTLLTAVVATGAGSARVLPDQIYATTMMVEVEGITTATLQVEGRLAGGAWFRVPGSSAMTADGLQRIDVSGLAEIRANVTSWTSGAITVTAAIVYG